MNKLTKLSLAVLFALGLAACGDENAVSKPANATNETAQTETQKATSYIEIPAINPAILEPITISDKKTATGIDDFNLLVKWSNKANLESISKGNALRRAIASPETSEYVNKNGKLPESLQVQVDDVMALINQVKEQLVQLKSQVKDPDVLAIMDRYELLMADSINISTQIMLQAPKLAKLKNDSPEVLKFLEDSKVAKAKVKQAQDIVKNAMEAFANKYQ